VTDRPDYGNLDPMGVDESSVIERIEVNRRIQGLEFMARSLAEAVLRSVRPSTVTHEDCGCLTCQATALVAALDAGSAGR
jgi:hypothetical protein